MKKRPQTLLLIIAAVSLLLVGRFLQTLSGVVLDSLGFWLEGRPLPGLTQFMLGVVSFISSGWAVPTFFVCLAAISFLANRRSLVPDTGPSFFGRFADRVVAARSQINAICRWVARVALCLALLLLILWPSVMLLAMSDLECATRQNLVAAIYGDDATIAATANGRKIFAPNKLLELLKRRLRVFGLGSIRYNNVNFNAKPQEGYAEWVFDLAVVGPPGEERRLFHGRAVREKVREWNLELKQFPIGKASELPSAN